MPKFSLRSQLKLQTCHVKLQAVFEKVVKKYDCIIICGHRGKFEQDEAYEGGKSKLKFPRSKHNSFPSMAVDVAPYHADKPHIRWDDLGGFYMFAGYVLRVADEMGIKLRYGGDWDGDKKTTDQKFNDLPHFELIPDGD